MQIFPLKVRKNDAAKLDRGRWPGLVAQLYQTNLNSPEVGFREIEQHHFREADSQGTTMCS